MKKTSMKIGESRRDEYKDDYKAEESRGRLAGALFALGVLAICTALVLPMRNKPVPDSSDAVAVMSVDAWESAEKEHLAEPREVSADDPNWSIFEFIGEWIADLIRGE